MDTRIDNKTERNIYNNYRSALRAMRKPTLGDSNTRASQLRQSARQVTAERYHVGHAEIKRIVAEYDKANGVTHEHTPEYLDKLDMIAAAEAYNANPTGCRQCGTMEDVSVRYAPYELEIENEKHIISVCWECYQILAEDI